MRRQEVISCFKKIYQTAINRPLFKGEQAVFDEAISIFISILQGRSFKEIAGFRFNKISRRDYGKKGKAKFSQPASKLPNSKLQNVFSIYQGGYLAKDVSYDAIIFDTYDYLDQVISFSLTDTFIAALKYTMK